MSKRPYPEGIDCVWLASDRDGYLGVIITAGLGPIPAAVLDFVGIAIDGIAFPTQALFPDLGGALGMLVLDSADTLDGLTRNALVDQGFSISAFSEPLPNEEFDIDGYAEMFAE